MKATGLDVAKILIYDERRSRSTVSVFLSAPTPLEEANLGRLFILSEIESTDRKSENIINIVEEEIAASYYGSSDFETDIAFENALSRANQRLHQLIREGHTSWLDTFSTIVAVVKGGTIHFSDLGRVHAFLVHSKQIIDLLDNSSRTDREKINPLKIFSNVVSGTLREDDAALFCTASLLDYLSLEKLRKTIYEHSAQEAAQYLQALLLENTINATFGGIIVKLHAEKDVMVEYGQGTATPRPDLQEGTATPSESMSNLIDKEQRTSELLEPSLLSMIRKRWESLRPRRQPTQPMKSERKRTFEPSQQRVGVPIAPITEEFDPLPKERGPEAARRPTIVARLLHGSRTVLSGLGKMLTVLLDALRKIFFKPKDTEQRSRSMRRRRARASQRVASAILRFQGMPRKRKGILLAALAFFIIFSWTIATQGERKEAKESTQTHSQSLSQAETKLAEAMAATVIENNQENVRKLLIEAKQLVTAVPETEKDLQAKRSELLTKVETELGTVNHIVRVEPVTLADIGQTFPEAAVSALSKLENDYYALDATANTLYRIASDGKVFDVDGNGEADGKLSMLMKSENTLVLFTSTKAVLEFNVPNTFTKRGITFTDAAATTITDAAIFNENIYLLDAGQNRLLKHTRTGENFSEGLPWITDGTSVASASALSVDGSIIVGKTNGELVKLFQGKKDSSFRSEAIDPKLENIQDLAADERLKNIYVLDRTGKRVVAYTKEGSFLRQYTSDRFTKLAGLFVDEASNTITVLNNTALLTFPIE